MQVPQEQEELVRRRPRIFYGWYIVGASVGLNAYLSSAFFQGFQVFFLPIINEFGWTRALTSVAFSLRQLESGVLAPVVGFLVDRFGGRRVILVGVLISGAGMVLLSLITSLWMFYATFALISVGMSGASHGITWSTVVANWFRRQRGRAMGLTVLGPVVGAPAILLVVLLEQAVGWRWAILGLGIGIWIVGIPLALVARSRPEEHGYLPDGDPVLPVAAAAEGAQCTLTVPGIPGSTAGQALRSRSFWVLVLIFGAQGIGMSGLTVHQIPYFQSIGFSTEQAASTVAIMFAFSGIGRLGAGVIMDLMDWRPFLAGVLGAHVVAFIILVNVTSYWQAVGFAGLLGIAFGSTIPARPLLVGTLFGMRAYGSIQGLLMSAAIASGVGGPVVMGWAFDAYGTYVPALLGFTAITAAAIPLPFLAKRPSALAQSQEETGLPNPTGGKDMVH